MSTWKWKHSKCMSSVFDLRHNRHIRSISCESVVAAAAPIVGIFVVITEKNHMWRWTIRMCRRSKLTGQKMEDFFLRRRRFPHWIDCLNLIEMHLGTQHTFVSRWIMTLSFLRKTNCSVFFLFRASFCWLLVLLIDLLQRRSYLYIKSSHSLQNDC